MYKVVGYDDMFIKVDLPDKADNGSHCLFTFLYKNKYEENCFIEYASETSGYKLRRMEDTQEFADVFRKILNQVDELENWARKNETVKPLTVWEKVRRNWLTKRCIKKI